MSAWGEVTFKEAPQDRFSDEFIIGRSDKSMGCEVNLEEFFERVDVNINHGSSWTEIIGAVPDVVPGEWVHMTSQSFCRCKDRAAAKEIYHAVVLYLSVNQPS